MKKIISLILMIAMLISVSAFAGDEFTLHNGTKFGMTQEEVVEIEKQDGFNIANDTGGHAYPQNAMTGKGTIANQPNTEILYGFRDNSLYSMVYEFSDVSAYEEIENGLTQKYGTTKYSFETELVIPSFANEKVSIPFSSYGFDGIDFNRIKYSHRLISLPSDEMVFIEHYTKVMTVDGRVSDSRHTLRYHLLSTDEMNTLEQKMNQVESDL